ncbi:MAG: hypothetical protein ACI4FZ_08910 [Lachnospiraceae bacterium]
MPKPEQDMQGYITALRGINYKDWIKLKNAIDRTFERSIGEYEKTLELADADAVAKIIRSQFE